MIFLILSIGLVFGLGCYNFISNIYYNVLLMIYISNNTYNIINNDFYYINEIYRSNYIVYYNDNDKELKSYYCKIAYTSLEDSKLHLYCYNYNINNNEKEGKMSIQMIY